MRTDEAKLWFQDFHAIKRVSMASHSLTTFAGRSIWCRSSSGPWHPTHSADGTTAAHVTSAADRPWNCHHSPFRIDWNEVEQRELLAEAKRFLETGELFPRGTAEAQPRSLTRQMPRPKPATASQRRTWWSHWQTVTAATVTTHPLVSRNQRHQRRQQLPLLQREQP